MAVEISADFPNGATEQTKRVGSENADMLGFKSKLWEQRYSATADFAALRSRSTIEQKPLASFVHEAHGIMFPAAVPMWTRWRFQALHRLEFTTFRQLQAPEAFEWCPCPGSEAPWATASGMARNLN